MTALRCKPGDLALVTVGSNAGCSVTCLELAPGGVMEVPGGGFIFARPDDGPIWRVDKPMRWWGDDGALALAPYAADRYLMPIRPERDPESVPTEREVTA